MAKRAASAYWLWLEESRASVVKTHALEGKKGSEVSKKAGEIWKSMQPAEKQKYEELAAKDKERYEQEVQTLGKRVKKARQDEDAPKQPLSAFFMWMQDTRENIKKSTTGTSALKDFTRDAPTRWKGLADSVKQAYEKKAALAKEQYRKDLELYHVRKAALMSGRTESQLFSGSGRWPMGGTVSNANTHDADACECGEPFNGMAICEQCGASNANDTGIAM
eukprot:TRINITY_DN30322_c0_g1_i1.p1 TRINITY_DN30322_c0_g1~~TRINITY_DN30322_c0_g1_i1.p1  ORF type:complete len:250 (+),score=60.92 TRINITY_DN30322_c0_g1_i1:90-752(+)